LKYWFNRTLVLSRQNDFSYIAATAACFTEVKRYRPRTFASSTHTKKDMQSKFNTFVIALLTLSTFAMADAPSTIKVAAAGNIFTLHYSTPPAGIVKVSIVDVRNQVVFTESINESAAFTRPYNFSQLEKGEYKIIVEDRSGRQEQIVKYGISESNTFVKISEMNKQESRYVLSIGNSAPEKVTVRIYDNAKGLVHEQQIEVDGNYGLIYNLSKVRSSQKSIVLFEVSTSEGLVTTAMF
jgi:hypothetical protein